MKITYDDLTDTRTAPFEMLTQMDKEAERLERQAQKIRKLNCAIVRLIQDGRITDTKDIECAITWLYHSNLEPWEIVNKVLENA